MPHKTKEKNSHPAAVMPGKFSLQGQKGALNPALSSLFSSSSGPVQTHVKYATLPPARIRDVSDRATEDAATTVDVEEGEEEEEAEEDDEELSEASGEFDDEADAISVDDLEHEMKSQIKVDSSKASVGVLPISIEMKQDSKKRKRTRDNDNLEGAYLQRLAREDEKEEALREKDRQGKRQKQSDEGESSKVEEEEMEQDDFISADDEIDDIDGLNDVPLHETLAPPKSDTEFEKASRTVFLGNVSTTAMTSKSDKKTLLNHLSSFSQHYLLMNLHTKSSPSVFRSTAYSSNVPKKAAFAKKELMDTTTKGTNAYVVFSTNKAAREAAQRLNGTVVLGRHLRVDEVAHPAKIDNKRCIFVGNLGFVDDESQIKAAAAEMAGKTNSRPSKSRAGDVEEGLWQHFSKAGKVESVRVVRDPKTRVGKGFAYVQFEDQNTVETALLDNDKSFPPLLPRKLRVVRAKKMFKKPDNAPPSGRTAPNANRNTSRPENSNLGRAKKLLGRAGGAGVARNARQPNHGSQPGTASNNIEIGTRGGGVKSIRAPESFVFEGHRASNTQGKGALRINRSKGGKKKVGKPRDRSAKRAAAWKSSGGRDARREK